LADVENQTTQTHSTRPAIFEVFSLLVIDHEQYVPPKKLSIAILALSY
jgi:hypothetical protein